MQSTYSPELRELLARVETALLRAGQNARLLAEQTGTQLIIKERKTCDAAAQDAEPSAASHRTAPNFISQ